MHLESAAMANSIVGGVGSLESCRLSYRVYRSHGLGEVLDGYVFGPALGVLEGVFIHSLYLYCERYRNGAPG